MVSLIPAILVVLAAILRYRLALFCFLLFIPLMPRYMALVLGSLHITIRLLVVSFLALMTMLALILYKNKRRDLYRAARSIWPMLAAMSLLFLIEIISTLKNAGIRNLSFVFYDIFYAAPVLLIIIVSLRNQKDMQLLIFAICLGLLFSELLGLLEYLKKGMLLQGIIDVDKDSSPDFFMERIRDGQYRIRALFDNPLLLSEYVCVTWPFSWLTARHAKNIMVRGTAILSLMLIPITLFLVGSRAGVLIFGMGVFAHIWAANWHSRNIALKVVIRFSFAAVLCLVIYVAANILASPSEYFSKRDQGGISAIERITQYIVVTETIIQKPYFGFGKQGDIGSIDSSINNIDSYWLMLALEAGIFGMLIFAVLFIMAISRSYKFLYRAATKYDRSLSLAIFISLLSLMMYKFFLSIPWNNVYLFVSIAILAGRERMLRDDGFDAK